MREETIPGVPESKDERLEIIKSLLIEAGVQPEDAAQYVLLSQDIKKIVKFNELMEKIGQLPPNVNLQIERLLLGPDDIKNLCISRLTRDPNGPNILDTEAQNLVHLILSKEVLASSPSYQELSQRVNRMTLSHVRELLLGPNSKE